MRILTFFVNFTRHAGVPLIYLNKVIMVLEPPSEASLKFNKHVETVKSGLKTSESDLVSSIK